MTLKDQAAEAASQARNRATEFARTAEAQINDKRKTAAAALDSAAGTVHRASDTLPVGDRAASFGHAAAGRMESAADYLGDHDVRDMAGDVRRFVKKHPGRSVIAAVAIGFMVGRLFRRG